MSDGLNREFKKGVRNFLAVQSFSVFEADYHHLRARAGNPQPMRVNLIKAGVKVTIQLEDNPGRNSNAFLAYFAPFKAAIKELQIIPGSQFYASVATGEGVGSVQLGNDADYFFTEPLTGCRLALDPNNVVRHIAGDFSNEQMNHMNTGPRCDGAYFGYPRYWDNDHDAAYASVVVGRRVGIGQWRFYQQYLTGDNVWLDSCRI